ncbi:MAG TPA: hypothetical protein VL993_17790 [Stellaceae bacterium]|nr:hypothetical protein [Stellaceae bacterium]
MALRIETFSNTSGGNAFFKAVTHPLAARAAARLLRRLETGPVAIYDPDGRADGLAELYDFNRLDIAGCFVQEVGAIGKPVLGRPAQPVTELAECRATTVLVVTFDAERPIAQIRHLLPKGAEVESLDAIRLPDEILSRREHYLDPLNFATNFAFFRDQAGLATRLVTANYWAGYGGQGTSLWLLLVDDTGRPLAEWREPVAEGIGTIVIDSRLVRERFALPEFTGQLFLHVIGARGHDVVKYALDIFGSGAETSLSATHDANSWPADLYAGLPAPAVGERVTLWVQNSQPCPIPAGEIGLNLMGDPRVATLDCVIPPYGTCALDVSALLPGARWPDQIEVHAGKYFVRPRYEVSGTGRRRIAHVNVERSDLRPDPKIADLSNILGKAYLLPAPILPRRDYRTVVLPTPMTTAQQELPIAIAVYDRAGREIARQRLGRVMRRGAAAFDIDDLLDGAALPDDYGHLELVYDFSAGGEADGWLHGLFRYEHRASGFAAETSFGAHVFNTVLTYRGEPQSYSGRAPGLSTRLFLRVGENLHDTLCHLIYPASTPWHELSDTHIILHDARGKEIARRAVAIACSGSLCWRYRELFDAAARAHAGDNPYIVIRDTTCRLFGYHGLLGASGAFSLDHMFGF